ncbi:MAG: hypothetical protein K2F65_01030 [Eubacterium sp.]|nr:hypothetical protein [Eubacterium sp.]
MTEKEIKELKEKAVSKVKTKPAGEWYKMHHDEDKNDGFWNAKTRSEELADAILNNDGVSKLFSIRKITRCDKSRSYFVKEHNIDNAQKKIDENKKLDENKNPKLGEVLICNKMFISSAIKPYDCIGSIIDYQTPMRNTANDKGYKGVDLISYNKDEGSLILLEAKKPGSQETLLRAVLEVFTYWKIIDHQKLLYDFSENDRCKGLDVYNTTIKKAVLIFDNSSAYREYYEGTSPKTIELMKKLGVDFYGIREKDDDYEVFIPEIE